VMVVYVRAYYLDLGFTIWNNGWQRLGTKFSLSPKH
jgi:hypothetical protein